MYLHVYVLDMYVYTCTTESARRAATFKILRAIGIDLMHKQAYIHDGNVG